MILLLTGIGIGLVIGLMSDWLLDLIVLYREEVERDDPRKPW